MTCYLYRYHGLLPICVTVTSVSASAAFRFAAHHIVIMKHAGTQYFPMFPLLSGCAHPSFECYCTAVLVFCMDYTVVVTVVHGNVPQTQAASRLLQLANSQYSNTHDHARYYK